MWTRTLFGLALIICLVACGDDKGSNTPPDTTAPATILDVTITDSSGTSMTFTWTASGDDGDNGTASHYDIRYATEPITEDNWDDATGPVGHADPSASGTSESATLTDLTWWTRYYVAVRIGDESDNWSAISNVAVGAPYPDPAMRLLVSTDDGILKVDMQGATEVFIDQNRTFEVLGDRVYTAANSGVSEYMPDGTFVRLIARPDEVSYYTFSALPDSRFAMMSNGKDSVFVIDADENVLASAGLLPEPDNTNQNLDCVLAGNYLVISEDGNNHLMRMNLDTYEITEFKDMTMYSGWLGAIDYYNGTYCICQSQTVYEFTDATEPELIATIPDEEIHISGAVSGGGHIFITVNGVGKIYRVNRTTGEIVLFTEGLNDPRELEWLPN